MVPAAIQGVTVSAPAQSKPVTVALGILPMPRPKFAEPAIMGCSSGSVISHHVGLACRDIHFVEERSNKPESDCNDGSWSKGEGD